MHFELPYALIGLLAIPVLLAAYLWQLRRRRKQAVRYSSVALIRAAQPRQGAWRRHVPLALVLASLAMLAVASARPQVRATVPVASSAVILAIDVSGSMCSTDVSPNRLAAAQQAVRRFIDGQDSRTRIGLVVFAGFAQVAVAPTTNHDELLSAVDSLTTGRGTTIGAAILKSIDAIAEINPDVAPADNSADTDSQGATPLPPPSAPPTTPSSPGGGANSTNKAPEIVVLLTDGANTRGITPEAAAKQAAARGVRVFPIGFGTTEPTQMVCTAEQLGGTGFDAPGRGFGGGFGPGSRNFLIVDEEALRTVASTTGGEYFKAQDADQLDGVLRDLPKHVDVQKRDVEVSVVFAGLAALLLVGGLWLAGRWSGTGT